MKVLIQCAGSKHPFAPSLSCKNKAIEFVAKPALKPGCSSPWGPVPGMKGLTWIDCIRALNGIEGAIPWRSFAKAKIDAEDLHHASDLYLPGSYSALTDRLGFESVFVLSAGWGLLGAGRLAPTYDVTFSQTKKRFKKISPHQRSEFDTVESGISGKDEIHLFLTPKYLDYLSCAFSQDLLDRAILHWRKGQAVPRKFANVIEHDCGDQRTNWHYSAVWQFLERQVS